jgi:hypothetical protein
MFDEDLTPVPFRIDDVPLVESHPPVRGLADAGSPATRLEVDELWAEGLIHLEAKALQLEYQLCGVRDGQSLQTEVASARIPLEDLVALELITDWWRTEILVQTRTLKALADVPGARHGELTLLLQRDARGPARVLIAEAMLRAAELHGD